MGEVSREATTDPQAIPGGPWTSGLDANGLAIAARLGFAPVAYLVASATVAATLRSSVDVWHQETRISYRGTRRRPVVAPWGSRTSSSAYTQVYPCLHHAMPGHVPGFNVEDLGHEESMRESVGLALARLRQQAEATGAHGVINVRLINGAVGGAREVRVAGTALRRPGAPLLPEPFTTNVSAQELAKLIAAGLVPVSVVVGIASVQVLKGCAIKRQLHRMRGAEVPQLSDAANAARRLVLADLDRQVALVGDGVVGSDVDFATRSGHKDSLLVELSVVGNAVRRFSEPQKRPAALPIMNLARTRPSGPPPSGEVVPQG